MSALITDEMVEVALEASYDLPKEPGYTFLNRDSYHSLWKPHMRAALEAVLPQIAAKVLRDAAEEIDGYTDWEEYKNRTSEVPHGWSDESIYDALMSSGVITDWLRNRANRIEKP